MYLIFHALVSILFKVTFILTTTKFQDIVCFLSSTCQSYIIKFKVVAKSIQEHYIRFFFLTLILGSLGSCLKHFKNENKIPNPAAIEPVRGIRGQYARLNTKCLMRPRYVIFGTE